MLLDGLKDLFWCVLGIITYNILIDADRIVVDEVSELKKRNNTIVHANDTHFDTTKQQGPTAPAHSVYLNLDK